ncbi:hypothetical protein [Roseococcus suduntuyensis]|uniref:Uncharacterized protein n=1 Tax=Roseococcus suduntuyensis TaxID=455361 RepID=A0A840AF34_9PROT|nr:hypothetical protein [Roseococcus suduntuyensis]MBB3899156.1 hypothetical protein [Roseococcus suduntuyensis]
MTEAASPAQVAPTSDAISGHISDWARLAAGACLSGELEAGGRHITLFLDLSIVPPALAGRRLQLRLGETGLMAVPLRPSTAQLGPAQFGPLRLTLADALRHAGSPPRLLAEGLPPLPPGRLAGAALQAMAVADEASFLARAARRDGREADPLLAVLGARAAYRALPGFAARAAALTLLAELLLARDLARLTADDHAEARWLRAEGRVLLAEGRALLDDNTAPEPLALRWMMALGAACGMLCLCQDDMTEARACFGAAAAQASGLHLAPEAALDLVHACLMEGVLLGLEGEAEAARQVLERGVRALQPSVTARNLMTDIAALDELIAAGRMARQCFVALAKFGLLTARATPRYHEGTPFELRHFAPSVPRLLAAGLCPRLADGLASLGIARP